MFLILFIVQAIRSNIAAQDSLTQIKKNITCVLNIYTKLKRAKKKTIKYSKLYIIELK